MRLYSAKETYNFKEPTNRSHPIPQSEYKEIKETGVQPIADNVAKNLELFLKTFNLVPGEPGFSWDLSLVPHYYPVLIVNSGSLKTFQK